MSDLTLIAAHGLDRAIGAAGHLPWHYPKDLAHFKRETSGATLIVGRTTWESFNGPLPGRKTVVMTRQQNWDSGYPEDEVKLASSVEEALAKAKTFDRPIFCAGGEQTYRMFLPRATHQILTLIPEVVPNADAFYPIFNENEWSIDRTLVEDGLKYVWLSR